jgi:hypothetical protein
MNYKIFDFYYRTPEGESRKAIVAAEDLDQGLLLLRANIGVVELIDTVHIPLGLSGQKGILDDFSESSLGRINAESGLAPLHGDSRESLELVASDIRAHWNA